MLITAYIALFICPAIVPLPERHPCFSLASKVFLVLRVVYPKLRTNEVKKGNDFSKKREKKKPKVRFGFSKRQVQALRVWKKISTRSGSIFLHKLAFWKPFTDKTAFFFPFSFGKMFMC